MLECLLRFSHGRQYDDTYVPVAGAGACGVFWAAALTKRPSGIEELTNNPIHQPAQNPVAKHVKIMYN
jgi:hypothetical protein